MIYDDDNRWQHTARLVETFRDILDELQQLRQENQQLKRALDFYLTLNDATLTRT